MYSRLVRFTRFAAAQGMLSALRLAGRALARREPAGPAAPPTLSGPQPVAVAPLPPDLPRDAPPLPPAAPPPVPSLAHLIEPPGTRPPPDTDLVVGVIMPVYNRAAMVGHAIRSLQAQTYPHWRLYVVDDASTDATLQVLAQFAGDARIRVLASPAHAGAAAARNLALAAAAADGLDVIAYLDSDNAYFAHYLAEVARAYAAAPDLQCAYCAMLWVQPGKAWLCFDAFDAEALREMRMSLDMNAFSHRIALASQAGGYDPRMQRYDDWDIILRCIRRAVPVPLPVLGVHYADGTWARITNTEPNAPYTYRVREKHLRLVGAGRRVLLLACGDPGQAAPAIDCEARWLRSRGFEVRVYPGRDGASDSTQELARGGSLEAALDAFRPHAAHAHGLDAAARHAPALAARGITLTVRGDDAPIDAAAVDRLLQLPVLARLFLLPQHAADWPAEVRVAAMPASFDGSRFIPGLDKPAAPREVLCTAACLPGSGLEAFFRIAARSAGYRFRAALASSGAAPGLPDQLRALNAALGSPVDLCFDAAPEDLVAMARAASVYLHTADPAREAGMPVCILEAMACGAVPLLPDAASLHALAGPSGLAYTNEDDALARLHEMAQWDHATWSRHAAACAEHAYFNYVDSAVLGPLGELLAAAPVAG